MVLVDKVDTVWFSVKDMRAAVRFYRDVLGLETIYESPYWTSFQLGETQIGLHGPEDTAIAAPLGGWIVSVLTKDLKKLQATLIEAGTDCDLDFHETPRGQILTFRDPDGNQIQAMQLHDNQSQWA